MSLLCPRCSRTLEFSGDRPSFCSYCGQRLTDRNLDETSPFTPSPNRGVVNADTSETVAHVRERPVGVGMPERVATYTLVRVLGSGGMGTVYEAQDETTGRSVALKLIAPEFVASRDALERFCQEGRLASMLEHPRCVFVLTADEDAQGRPYIVMELMPGATLQALVEDVGPLSVEDALTRILDVIEGLQEAHQLGIVHRDVKPANCFLDQEGRVKVGDFGLSKSLTQESSLTRTGSFIGTPLYASPEQIKGNPVDVRTDVYSVAATLYYLLVGRPPFQAKDSAATLARIVSEEPEPLRKSRADLPAGLEAAILRGLDRDRDRRWRDLDEFRSALLPYLPSRLSFGGIGLRVGAFLVDALGFTAVFGLLNLVLAAIVTWLAPTLEPQIDDIYENRAHVVHIVVVVVWVLYFAVAEGVWGASFGKRMMGLRVADARVGGQPSFSRALLRSVLFYVIAGLPADTADFLFPDRGSSELLGPAETIRRALIFATTTIVAVLASSLILISTMRARSGYRGPHEWLSRTRVVRVAREARRRTPRARRNARSIPDFSRRPMGVLETIGPYRVRGAVRREPDRQVLVGEDPGLGRQVWIVMGPKERGAPGPKRRELTRVTRPRWLTGGEQEGSRWDAYIAPAGCPLADIAGPHGLSWDEARPILEDLATELAAATADGTLPEGLSVDQIWIQPDGHVVLVDALAATNVGQNDASEELGALDLFAQVAALALEGGRRRSGTQPTTIHRAVPGHIARLFDRLLGRGKPYVSVNELCEELEATRDLPTHVSRERRAVHLLVQGFLLIPGVACMVGLPRFLLNQPTDEVHEGLIRIFAGLVLAWPIAWILHSALTRGGLSLRLLKIALVRRDNRAPGLVRCAWRAFLVWAPISVLLWLSLAYHFGWLEPIRSLTPEVLFWSAVGLLPLWIVLALINPERGIPERLSGTYLVPD